MTTELKVSLEMDCAMNVERWGVQTVNEIQLNPQIVHWLEQNCEGDVVPLGVDMTFDQMEDPFIGQRTDCTATMKIIFELDSDAVKFKLQWPDVCV